MFRKEKVLILGLARSGVSCAKLLRERGNYVVVNDSKEKEEFDSSLIKELEDIGVEFVFGGHPDDLLEKGFTYLIKSPGIAIDHKYVILAKLLQIPVINELEVAYQILRKEKNVTIIGITGTNGKTTTTTLIYEMIKKSGKKVHLAGNIGNPLCNVVPLVSDGDILVVETSCQQLENTMLYKPDIAVMTNISEAHLEFMKTFEHYKYVKSSNDLLIVNKSDRELMDMTKEAKARKKYFSIDDVCDCYFKDEAIYYNDYKVIDTNLIKLVGHHNYENIMASILACIEVGVNFDDIKEVLTSFTGVSHRLEFVLEKDGVKYYNDTEATNIKCTQIALSSFKQPIILILGGYERGQDFYMLKDYCENVKTILAIGSTKERVLEFASDMKIETYGFDTLKEAMEKMIDITSPGDVVLLSPASASWDYYEKCEDRGDEFKDFVKNL